MVLQTEMDSQIQILTIISIRMTFYPADINTWMMNSNHTISNASNTAVNVPRMH